MGTSTRLRTQFIFQLEAGSTRVLLDWTAARILLGSVKEQYDTSEIIKIHAQCASLGSSMISNLPISRLEARNLISDLTEFVDG